MKKSIRFIRQKGSCGVGYIGDIEEVRADSLIKNGYAVEHKAAPVEPAKSTKSSKLNLSKGE